MNMDDIVTNALAAPAAAPAEPAAAEPAPEAEGAPAEGAEPEAEGEPAEASADGAEAEDPGEQAPPPEPVLASDDALVELDDGEKVTIEELRKGSLRHADYTRKTQELGEQRRALANERQKFESDQAEVAAFLQQMHDPDVLEAQCLEVWPDAFERAVERRAKELLALSDKETSEHERDLIKRERDLRVQRAGHDAIGKRSEARKAVEQKRHEEEAQAQRADTLRRQFNAWAAEASAAVGLDTSNQDHADLMYGFITSSVPKGVQLTAEHFMVAAKRAAKVLGVKPAQPEAPKVPVQPKRTPPPPATPRGGSGSSRATPVNGRRPAAAPISTSGFLSRVLSSGRAR